MKSSFHSLIPFLPLSCNCQLNSIPLLPVHIPAGWRLKLDSILLNWALLYNHFARTTQKTQILLLRRRVDWSVGGVLTGPSPSNGYTRQNMKIFRNLRVGWSCSRVIYHDRTSCTDLVPAVSVLISCESRTFSWQNACAMACMNKYGYMDTKIGLHVR
jgi:hypothetical protein